MAGVKCLPQHCMTHWIGKAKPRSLRNETFKFCPKVTKTDYSGGRSEGITLKFKEHLLTPLQSRGYLKVTTEQLCTSAQIKIVI